jgi:hypothetical protein
MAVSPWCQEYVENTNFFPLTQYAAFALPQIQLKTSSPGFATGEIQVRRCRFALSNPR